MGDEDEDEEHTRATARLVLVMHYLGRAHVLCARKRKTRSRFSVPAMQRNTPPLPSPCWKKDTAWSTFTRFPRR